MAKIYPLIIESIIPSFYNIIRIPFKLNRGNSVEDIQNRKIEVLIKSSLDRLIARVEDFPEADYSEVRIGLSTQVSSTKKLEQLLQLGEYYKFQIRIKADLNQDEDETTFSTVGVGHYINTPIITIDNGTLNSITNATVTGHTFIGAVAYSDESIGYEKPEQYRFTLYDGTSGQILDSSGWQYHNNDQDSTLVFKDVFVTNKDLTKTTTYNLYYEVKTTNLLELSIF